MSFTLFVKLPNDDVCSLRRLPARSSIRAVRKLLEVTAGLPAHMYDLACPKGKLFESDDALLELHRNVWEGYVLRVVFKASWQTLYDAVVASDADRVLELCLEMNKGKKEKEEETEKKGVGEKEGQKDEVKKEKEQGRKGENGKGLKEEEGEVGKEKKQEEKNNNNNKKKTKEEGELKEEEEEEMNGKGKELVKDGRGVVALYVASFLGLAELCRALVCAGVNPDGKTPFGRTPLFAAMSGDHVPVTEVLLSRQAELEARDEDGVTALDVARERQAKDCLRKARHVKLFSRASSAASSSSSRTSRASAPGTDLEGGGKSRRSRPSPRAAIRIPTGIGLDASAESQAQVEGESGADVSSSSTPRSHHPPSHNTVPAVSGSVPGKDGEEGRTVRPPTRNDTASPKPSGGGEGGGGEKPGVTHGVSSLTSSSKYPAAATLAAGSRPSPRALFHQGEVYAWDNNLRSLSRASSAAGTQARFTPVRAGPAGRERVSSARCNSRASSGGGHGGGVVSWSDTLSVFVSPGGTSGGSSSTIINNNNNSNDNKRPSVVRISVQELAISGPDIVLKVSPYPSTPPHTTSHTTTTTTTTTTSTSTTSGETLMAKDGPERDERADFSPAQPNSREANEPHTPAEEPPGRPPSPHGDPREVGGGAEGSQTGAESAGITVQGSERSCGENEKEKGHVQSSSRASSRQVRFSRGKQQASWRTTMKRRLRLAEDQKRHSSPPKCKPSKHSLDKDSANKANFEQWLRRKRREKERQQRDSSDDDDSSSSSSADRDGETRSEENEKAFNDWLRELKERPLKGPHPYTVASLHRRKTRPLKNLIQVGGVVEDSVPVPDPDTYMTAYQEWRQRKSSTDSEEPLTSPRDLKAAKRRMEQKRRSLLAMALSYEDWLDLSEQQRKLMQAVLRADSTNNKPGQDCSPTNDQQGTAAAAIARHRAPRQISFQDWCQRLQKREAEQRNSRSCSSSRGGGVFFNRNGSVFIDDDNYGGGGGGGGGGGMIRSSAAIPHDEWLRKKREEADMQRRNLNKKHTGAEGGGGGGGGRCLIKPGFTTTTATTATTTATTSTTTSSSNIGTKGNRSVGAAPAAPASSSSSSLLASDKDGEKDSAWEKWLQRKHQSEMEKLTTAPSGYQGKQLLLSLHEQKKAPRVTPC